mmetsp:Transcript_21465/g.26398  ORF Transcript_21465/g.26398 Transcript_21465/m.26398 type:complete len:108 (+) Transcript_21465:44-367(+)
MDGIVHTFDAKLLSQPADIPIEMPQDTSARQMTSQNGDSSRVSKETKLPGLVIKGQGNESQPLNVFDKTLRKKTTVAYALSPKLIRQLRIEEKVNESLNYVAQESER